MVCENLCGYLLRFCDGFLFRRSLAPRTADLVKGTCPVEILEERLEVALIVNIGIVIEAHRRNTKGFDQNNIARKCRVIWGTVLII